MRYIPNEQVPFAIGAGPANGASDIGTLASELESRGFRRIDIGYHAIGPGYPVKPLHAWRKRVDDQLQDARYDVIVNALIPEDIMVRMDDPFGRCQGDEAALLCRHVAGILEPRYIEYYPPGKKAVRQQYRAAASGSATPSRKNTRRDRGGMFVRRGGV